MPSQLPSAAGLVYVVKLVGLVTFAYYVSIGRSVSVRGIATFVMLMIGALGMYEGFTRAAREESRARYGRVVSGVVIEMYMSNGRGRTYASNGREGPRAGASGYLIYEGLARWIATGSARTRMVAYRYPCEGGREGRCLGRDFIGPELWSRLTVGKTLNVRMAEGETVTARLDENPQWTVAFGQMGIAAVFLIGAALLSGRFRLWTRPRYLAAHAVVTAVEEIKYRDTTRWKIRFAYMDQNGEPQESADEVSSPNWKPGADCVAVFRPEARGLATLQLTKHSS